MSTVPTKPDQAITWVQSHTGPWTTNAELLKLDPATITELASLATAAETARQNAAGARDVYEASLESYDASVKAMRTLATGQVAIIRSTARNAANPQQVYAAGLIPPPADPSPTPAPGTPTMFKHALSISGQLSVRFRCPNPGRTGAVTYRVERRIGGSQMPFVPYSTLKERKFTDTTIPLGSSEVAYRITPQTSTKDGGVAQFAIQFGAGNQSTLVEQVPDQPAVTAEAS